VKNESLADRLRPAVEAYLRQRPELLGNEFQVALLAQGEYNLNFLIETPHTKVVFRISTGSQEIATGAAQILYEARALEFVSRAGVAPRLLHVDTSPPELPYGLLLEEYLPGRPLEYGQDEDLRAAAQTLARLHHLTPPAEPHRFFTVERPLEMYLQFGREMADAYRDWSDADTGVLRVLERTERGLEKLAARQESLFAPAGRRIVHTDVQAHNFVVGDASTRLVDWEKPVADDPSFDLCHFLAKTTTRWKCGVDLNAPQQEVFLAEYTTQVDRLDPTSLPHLEERIQVRQPFVYWRAITWCAMALVEYQDPDRPIRNADTLARIEEYLRPEFLEEIFAPVLTLA
jgi:Ser/Thr protein kinase RdoA (MazF antagonist)